MLIVEKFSLILQVMCIVEIFKNKYVKEKKLKLPVTPITPR